MTSAHSVPDFQANWKTEEIAKPTMNGVWEFPQGSIMTKDDNDVYRSATLPKEIRFKDLVLSAGFIEFRSGGRSWSTTLAEPLQQQGLNLPAGAYASVSIDGTLRFAQTKKAGFFNENPIMDNTPIRFYNTGKIDELTLAPNSELFGNQFSKPVNLKYDDTGVFQSLVVDEPVTIAGIQFDGNWIFFYPSGKIRSGILNVDARINSILYATA